MEAYTYTIKHIPTNTIYYGVRKSTNFDLGIRYFSSSNHVKRMIEIEPIENFQFRLRRQFNSYHEALLHEHRLLQRVKAVSNPRFLNRAISSPTTPMNGSPEEERRRENIRQSMLELWKDSNYKNNHPWSKIDKEEASRRGRNGALKRAENYKNKEKKKRTPKYGTVLIHKNGKQKVVKSNFVPAYKKCGWERVT